MQGLLNLNKPSGMTSRAALDQAVRWFPRKLKAGHTGTLDPLASGVLVLALGSATRLVDLVQRMPKLYRTRILLGARSDTLDADGRVENVSIPVIPDVESIRQVLAGQVGEILQRPPAFSAVKVNGRRAYDLARAGQAVEISPRPVRIDRIEVLSYTWPLLELEVECGGGTYIRSIARDLGDALGCGGLVQTLVRTRIGPFTLGDALDLAEVNHDTLIARLLPARSATANLPSISLDEDQTRSVSQGRALDAASLFPGSVPQGEIALLDAQGRLLGLGECDGVRWIHPRKVLV